MDENCEIVEIVSSQKGNDKIKVHGRAITILNDGSHYLQKYFNNTHAPQASS
ncbi:6235_t:CDS:2, partial [Funneliformis geosporum]